MEQKRSVIFTLGVLSIIIIGVASLIQNPVSITGAQTLGSRCSETDDGNDIFTPGVTTFEQGTASRSFSDRCVSSKNVFEGFCSESGRANFKVIACPNGCRQGACVSPDGSVAKPRKDSESPSACVDSDDGDDPAIKGNASDGVRTLSDYCLGRSRLLESYCDQGTIRARFVICDCVDGSCLSEQETTPPKQPAPPEELPSDSQPVPQPPELPKEEIPEEGSSVHLVVAYREDPGIQKSGIGAVFAFITGSLEDSKFESVNELTRKFSIKKIESIDQLKYLYKLVVPIGLDKEDVVKEFMNDKNVDYAYIIFENGENWVETKQPAFCGDGVCEQDETEDTCALDCSHRSKICGDKICDYEDLTCPEDCSSEEKNQNLGGQSWDR